MSTKASLGIKIGSTLPNGGIVLDCHVEGFHMVDAHDIDYQFGHVIALLPDSVEKYATWAYVEDERGIVTTSGHYSNSLFSAVKDFARRVSASMEES